MFTKPFSEIEFDDIEAFCARWPEGVRVEYKQQIPNTTPKIVSSLANTLGGIIKFGVETDEKNMPILPIEGMPSDRGIQERIVESAFNGIHPPVTPEVKVCDVPDKNGNVVVVVRVDESSQAPHAIQNSTKVYIRVDSTTQLANIDRIEYMLKRRENPQELSKRIINRIDERLTDYWYLTSDPVPNLTLISAPVFPYRPLVSPSEIYEYMRAQSSSQQSGILFSDHSPDFGTRQVVGGVCFVGPAIPYWEINEHGIIYLREKLHKSPYDGALHMPDDDEQIEYLVFRDLLKNNFELIEAAKHFYQRYDYLGDVEIAAKLRHVKRESLMFGNESRYKLIQSRPSLDSEISASVKCYARDLGESEKANDVIVNLLSQLLWGFNIRPGEWESTAYEMLKPWRIERR